ncbi:hypothetical protein GGP41_000514 [Bipolaris sorokiniana]|uniref:Uncharacterized protein n=1 Tax=Cochliobolus sativus TaxID=45130 RepID=A0A8H5ZLX7_COCSA|nr:hypothetical protein GGP41_000514 [Bipolaris sorokiniana]
MAEASTGLDHQPHVTTATTMMMDLFVWIWIGVDSGESVGVAVEDSVIEMDVTSMMLHLSGGRVRLDESHAAETGICSHSASLNSDHAADHSQRQT